ncbi:barstar family protein [Streptomyces sp. NPDC050546]|uniref:barstar family protein n=1 Tax=Streptomyces sp. NPDC050546 TaxID=3365628 RepID=UPI0037AF20DF
MNILYQLVDKESGKVLLAAEDIRGFFVEQDLESADRFTFVKVRSIAHLRRKVEGVELQVVGRKQEPIGKYYLGRVEAAFREMPEVGPGEHPDMEFLGYTWEYPRAGEIWKKWAVGVELGEWARQSTEWHESWLHVVQNAWFTAGKRATRYQTGETVFLDGVASATPDAFYCALGETFNGPGGYFGATFEALDECLQGARNDGTHPSRLVWRDYTTSREALGDDFVDSIMAVFHKHGLTVQPH